MVEVSAVGNCFADTLTTSIDLEPVYILHIYMKCFIYSKKIYVYKTDYIYIISISMPYEDEVRLKNTHSSQMVHSNS